MTTARLAVLSTGGWEDCFAVRPPRLDCFAVFALGGPAASFLQPDPVHRARHDMYLLYLDESGSHVGSPALVLGGLAIHEHDAWPLQQKIEGMLRSRLPQGLDPSAFELHANEIKSPVRRKTISKWAQVSFRKRLEILHATYRVLAEFRETDAKYPCACFGAVVARQYGDREERAYEEVLNKFDEMLTRQAKELGGAHQKGIVIHDHRLAVERVVQSWTATWRRASGRIGRLTHLVDVPMFADSKASRLIQAADFIAWGLWRYYGDTRDEKWIQPVWARFDKADGIMHGLIHVAPGFRDGTCLCPPCTSRRPGKP